MISDKFELRHPAKNKTGNTKQVTIKLDSSLFIQLPELQTAYFMGSRKIPASPHDTLTVATSKRIGMEVIFKDFVIKPLPLKTQPKASINQIPLQETCPFDLPALPQVNILHVYYLYVDCNKLTLILYAIYMPKNVPARKTDFTE